MPKEFAAGDGAVSDQFLKGEEHGSADLIDDVVLVKDLEEKAVRGKWPLDRKPELLLDSTDGVFGGNSFGADLLALELSLDISIDSSEGVHLGELVSLDEADLELLELFLDLCRHQDLVGGVGARLVI